MLRRREVEIGAPFYWQGRAVIVCGVDCSRRVRVCDLDQFDWNGNCPMLASLAAGRFSPPRRMGRCGVIDRWHKSRRTREGRIAWLEAARAAGEVVP